MSALPGIRLQEAGFAWIERHPEALGLAAYKG